MLICSATFSLWAKNPSVEERDGNIYFRDGSGNLKQVTDSGKDRGPALSPDGSRIVFVRDLLGNRDYSDFSRVAPATKVMQLWIASAAGGSQSVKLVLDSPIEVRGRQFSGFYAPQFSSDNKCIFFLIQFGASSGAIVRLTVENKELTYITDALDFGIVPSGQYKNDLVAKQHRPKLGLGYYDWFYLLKPNGEQVGVIGQNQNDVSNFLDMYVGDVGACLSWNRAEWMTCINQAR